MAISGSGVLITDGSDGFGDLKIISSKEDRPYSDHGITMDFSLISVCVEHQVRGRRWGQGGRRHGGGWGIVTKPSTLVTINHFSGRKHSHGDSKQQIKSSNFCNWRKWCWWMWWCWRPGSHWQCWSREVHYSVWGIQPKFSLDLATNLSWACCRGGKTDISMQLKLFEEVLNRKQCVRISSWPYTQCVRKWSWPYTQCVRKWSWPYTQCVRKLSWPILPNILKGVVFHYLCTLYSLLYWSHA